MERPGHGGLLGGMRRPFGEEAGAVTSLPKGGRGCRDLPARLDEGSLMTRLAEKAQGSTECVAALPGALLPGCGEGWMLLPRASLVPLHPRRLLFLWFLSFVLPAAGERGAGDVISYL